MCEVTHFSSFYLIFLGVFADTVTKSVSNLGEKRVYRFFSFVKAKQTRTKKRVDFMDFTKEQLSELICKHTEKENGW